MKKPNISSLNPIEFTKVQPLRTETIDKAPATPIPPLESYRANAIAKALHPKRQFVVISKIDEISSDVKTFTLVPNEKKARPLSPISPQGNIFPSASRSAK